MPSGRVASESADDGYCDILEAISAASTGRPVHECANPARSTRIVLQGGARYPITKTLRFLPGAGPPLEVTVAGGTGERATITAADPWLLDPGDPQTSCLLSVFSTSAPPATSATGSGAVEVSDVDLSATTSQSLTGACVAAGALTVRRTHVTGFKGGGLAATCLPDQGCRAERGDVATLRVASSLVDANTTDRMGAGIYSAGLGATVAVYHSSIVGNTAAGAGGGLYLGGGPGRHVIQASTISGNAASTGGGAMVKLACSEARLDVVSTTIADNGSHDSGGGLQFEPADRACGAQTLFVDASVLAGNHSATTPESNINAGWDTGGGAFTCSGGSLIYVEPGYPRPAQPQPDAPCLLTSRYPRLGPLTPMGGVGDLPVHPLLADSPALDAVPTTRPLPLEDQRDEWIGALDPPRADDATSFDRAVDGDGDGRAASDLGAVEMSARWQTELLAVAAASPHQVVVTRAADLDRGAGTEYAATGGKDESVTYRVPVPVAGFYDFTVGVLRTPSGGTFQMAVAESPSGPWTDLGASADTFASAAAPAALGPVAPPGGLRFASAGEVLVRFTVAGRNAASGGYHLDLDYIDARRSTTACPIAELASGANHVCALTTAGGVRCWGANDSGQLGDGSTAHRWRTPSADALGGVAAIAVGTRHVCALTAAGGVRCWGANDSGQLGDGTTTSRPVPPATDVFEGAQAIAAGGDHTCALTTAGGVRCWGANGAGQLGDGSITDRSTPPTADALLGARAIVAGGAITCALTTSGGARCWGANALGQLGDGTTTDRSTPPDHDVIGGVTALAVASGHACAVMADGGARCWGHNGDSELGDGSYVDALSPPAAPVLAGVRDLAAGPNFTCALTAAGGVRCWGYNSDGQIGDETLNAVDRLTPADTDILDGVKAISVGQAHACALMTTGGARCWGANTVGQLADGLAPDAASIPPSFDTITFAGTCRP
ncbi:MAG TPA: hypothetical protein VIU64_21775 [Polyangia bacterium]